MFVCGLAERTNGSFANKPRLEAAWYCFRSYSEKQSLSITELFDDDET